MAAFRATLEEVIEASIILHVRDISHKDTDAQAYDVADVLKQLDVDPQDRKRVIEVWNKIDIVDAVRHDQLLEQAGSPGTSGQERHVVSALTGEGLDGLLDAIETRLLGDRPVHRLLLEPTDGAGLAWLYGHGEVLERFDGDDGLRLAVRVADKYVSAFLERFGQQLVEPE